MPILSHELRQSGEGAISLEGCTEVFKSFPPSKVPCNDGLAVEFYKMFLASRIKIAATLTLEADFSFKSWSKDSFESHHQKNETTTAGINTS